MKNGGSNASSTQNQERKERKKSFIGLLILTVGYQYYTIFRSQPLAQVLLFDRTF